MNKVIIVHYEEDTLAREAFEESVEHLWCKTVDFTRNAIISILGGLEDVEAVKSKLIKLQEEIGAAIIPYYGEAAASELTRLLKESITIAADIAVAVKDAKSTTELEATWNTNAEAIATFLDAADAEYWPKDVVLGLLKTHMKCTLAEMTARFAKEWTLDFAAYEECKGNIEKLAYAMADGILSKFPEYFVMQRSTTTIKKK